MTSMASAWQSERLMYRAVEDDDDNILTALNQDSESYMNATPYLPVPQGKAGGKAYLEFLKNCLLGVIICLPPPAHLPTYGGNASAESSTSKPIPIGAMSLSGCDPRLRHHQNTSLGIVMDRAYQGQGYGSEAIQWALHWAFMRAGLHKVEIGTFEYNRGALRLYQKLGFVVEGSKREHLWRDGRFWDAHMLSMLDREWKERYENRPAAPSGSVFEAAP